MAVRLTGMTTMKLSQIQIAALTFALTEGEVGTGCQGWAKGPRLRVVTNTAIGALVGKGLLVAKAPDEDGDIWAKLTEKGEETARAAFVQTRGHEWKSSKKEAS